MKLPRLNHIDTQTSTVDVFKGYNHNFRIGDGEFYDMKNLTSTYYPVLSPRSKRGTYVENISSQGMIAKDSLCYVDGSKFVINEHPIEMGLNDEPKQLISMGAYVIIMPDKKYINTINHTDKGNIEASFPSVESEIVTATYEMCKLDGTSYTNADEDSGAIYSKDDIKFKGKGNLTVNGNCADGIVGKDDVKIYNGNITVNAVAPAYGAPTYMSIFNEVIV